jgi:hypothetical protein
MDGWQVKKNRDSQIIVAGDGQYVRQLICNDAEKWFKNDVGYLMLPRGQEIEIKEINGQIPIRY